MPGCGRAEAVNRNAEFGRAGRSSNTLSESTMVAFAASRCAFQVGPAVELRECPRTRRHIGETPQPDEQVRIVEIPELADDFRAECFLAFDEFTLEQLDERRRVGPDAVCTGAALRSVPAVQPRRCWRRSRSSSWIHASLQVAAPTPGMASRPALPSAGEWMWPLHGSYATSQTGRMPPYLAHCARLGGSLRMRRPPGEGVCASGPARHRIQ